MDIRIILWALIACSMMFSCSKDDGPSQQPNPDPIGQPDPKVEEEAKSSEKQIISFRFPNIDNNGITVEIAGEIDHEGKTIAARFPSGTDITEMTPEVEISEKAVYEPTGPQDFTKPINYTVTAEDGTSRTYLVTSEVALSQKEILLKIAEANPSSTFDWDINENLSNWSGVTLDGEGRVTALNFVLFSCISVFPPEMELLNHLTSLRIFDCPNLPDGIDHLENLTHLEINLTGIETLPTGIFSLPNLVSLKIVENLDLKSLPSEIGQLSNLEELEIVFNNLIEDIPAEIGDLTSLETLDLRWNRLQSVPAILSNLNNLKTLYLEGNGIDIQTIPSSVCNMDVSNGGTTEIDIVEGPCISFTTTNKD